MLLFVQIGLELSDNFYFNGFFDDRFVIVTGVTSGKTSNSMGKINSKDGFLSIITDQKNIIQVLIKGIDTKCTIVYYTRPNSLQYYSLEPLTLDLDTKIFIEPHRYGTIDSNFEACGRDMAKFADLRSCLHRINQMAPKPRSIPIPPGISKLFLIMMSLLERLIKGFLYCLNAKIPGLKTSVVGLSSTAQQLNLRLEQFLFWPTQYLEWYSNENKQTPLAQAQYVGFFNTFWLVANDVIIGSLFKAVIMENRLTIAVLVRSFLVEYGLNVIQTGVTWLTAWPAGLKLNSELATFLGELFIWMIFAWRQFLLSLEPYADTFFTVILTSTFLGATFSLSLFSDFIALGTLHLQLFYIVSARVYHWALKIIESTFNLFRGRKWNPLRKRIDTAIYDLDQLLLGAVIFTLLVFLLPTVAVYYLLFSFSVILIVVFQSILEVLLAILNHFPLFAIMLRIKDPNRLPDGIYFVPASVACHKTDSDKRTLTHLELKNRPIGFRTIFYQYRYLFGRLLKYYLTIENLSSFIQGIRIKGLAKLSYPTMGN